MCLHFSQAIVRFYCSKFPGTNGKRRPKGSLWLVRLKKKLGSSKLSNDRPQILSLNTEFWLYLENTLPFPLL